MDITFEIWTKITSTILFRYFSFASISFVLFYVILKKPLWYRKIQQKIPKLTDYKRDIFCEVTASYSVFFSPGESDLSASGFKLDFTARSLVYKRTYASIDMGYLSLSGATSSSNLTVSRLSFAIKGIYEF